MGVHPIYEFIFWSSMMGFFWVIWCTYNNPTPLIQQSMGQNHHYPWVRVLEQHAALYTILYTILIGWVGGTNCCWCGILELLSEAVLGRMTEAGCGN